jgi:hypothetical protein
VVQVLGSFTLGGTVDGDIIQFSGDLDIGPGAGVSGNLQTSGGQLRGPAEQAVAGQVTANPVRVPFGAEWLRQSLGRQLGWGFGETLLLTLLAWVLARAIPRPLERIAGAATRHTLVSAAMGLLAGVVGLALIVQMVFTVLLIPVSLLGLMLLFISIGFGWIGFGVVSGGWLAERLNADWSFPLKAAIGTFVFMLALNLIGLIPGISDLLSFISAVIGLGAVFLTRFGGREFIPAS